MKAEDKIVADYTLATLEEICANGWMLKSSYYNVNDWLILHFTTARRIGEHKVCQISKKMTASGQIKWVVWTTVPQHGGCWTPIDFSNHDDVKKLLRNNIETNI
jgi:hypothetical protein